jgi:hypothetical protein
MHNLSPTGIATEEVDEEVDEDDPKRDGPGYDPDGNKISDKDDAEDNPGEGFVKEEGTDGETDDLTELEKKRLKANAEEEKIEEELSDKDRARAGGSTSHALGVAAAKERLKAKADKEKQDKGDEDNKPTLEQQIEMLKASDKAKGLEEAGAEQLGGMAGSKDAAFKKGLDSAFDIQAKVSAERNPIKRAMMSRDAKKVTRGVNKYMTALTGKLIDMTADLKSS